MSQDATVRTTIPVTLIPGDGIGPECIVAAQRILEAAGAPIEWETHEAGAEVFKKGLPSGVPTETLDSIARTRVALKGPLETPVGFGEKSANVTLRKLFETYANVRPVREMPGVKTLYSGRGVDLVVVRENKCLGQLQAILAVLGRKIEGGTKIENGLLRTPGGQDGKCHRGFPLLPWSYLRLMEKRSGN